MKALSEFNEAEQSRIIEMAWEDRTPFEAIEKQFGIDEKTTIKAMRAWMQASSFRMWRKRMAGRQTKHLKMRPSGIIRFRCPTQNKR